jgi:hypothetical protein
MNIERGAESTTFSLIRFGEKIVVDRNVGFPYYKVLLHKSLSIIQQADLLR